MQKEDKAPHQPDAEKNSAEKEPLSQTIANAHASGDGSLERDKDTILDTNEEQRQTGEGKTAHSNEAY